MVAVAEGSQAFDLLHFNAPQIAIRRFELGKLFGCPTLVSFRGQDISFHPERYDRLLREADHLHFISQDLLRQARARGFEGENFTLIPPLVDVDFYHPPVERDWDSKPFILFSAARLTWTKGWEVTLQAVGCAGRRVGGSQLPAGRQGLIEQVSAGPGDSLIQLNSCS